MKNPKHDNGNNSNNTKSKSNVTKENAALFSLVVIVCVGACVFAYAFATTDMWRSKHNFWELVLSFLHGFRG